jgi:flavin reductase (DIM6/NTAB) family NADH-FMN oxidoreductase RutF
MAKIEIPLPRALRLIAHGPVVLLTSESRGVPNIAACSWLTPACASPPLVAVSLGAGTLTRRLVDERGEFVLNVPPRALAGQVHYCGLVSGRDARKDRETGLRLEPAGRVRAPVLSDCIGHLECGVREGRPLGDHVLYVAEILLAVAEEGLFDEAWNTDDERARTLHHLGGAFYTSPGPRVEVDPRRPVGWPGGLR